MRDKKPASATERMLKIFEKRPSYPKKSVPNVVINTFRVINDKTTEKILKKVACSPFLIILCFFPN
jgi:hypothetical protein